MSETLRILSLNMDGCTDVTFFRTYVSSIAPDLLALQNTSAILKKISAHNLAGEVNASEVNSGSTRCMAFMSWNIPLRQVQEYDLGEGSKCLVADISAARKRFLFFNICLKGNFFRRPVQIRKLLSSDLLGRYDMLLPAVVAGDFMDTLWISSHPQFQSRLKRVSPLLLRTTYPACCPVLSRDRFYTIGNIEVEHIEVDNNASLRKNLTHLPLIMDMRVHTGANVLRTEPESLGKVGRVLSGSSIFKCH
ncbi:MAG: endonuclease/exonuclease/phosphatase family protein [Desulfuromonadaceae bacterium]